MQGDWDAVEPLLSNFEAWSAENHYDADLLMVWQTRMIVRIMQGRFQDALEFLPQIDAAIDGFAEAESWGQSVDREGHVRVAQITRSALLGHIALVAGRLDAARARADTAVSALNSFSHAAKVINVVITGVSPPSNDMAFVHDLLVRIGHPDADRVLKDAHCRLGDLADRFLAAGYERQGVWREDGFRAYLMERRPGQPGRTLVQVFADQRKAPAATSA